MRSLLAVHLGAHEVAPRELPGLVEVLNQARSSASVPAVAPTGAARGSRGASTRARSPGAGRPGARRPGGTRSPAPRTAASVRAGRRGPAGRRRIRRRGGAGALAANRQRDVRGEKQRQARGKPAPARLGAGVRAQTDLHRTFPSGSRQAWRRGAWSAQHVPTRQHGDGCPALSLYVWTLCADSGS